MSWETRVTTAQQRQVPFLTSCSPTAPGEGSRTGLVVVGCCTDSLRQAEVINQVQNLPIESSQDEEKDTKTRQSYSTVV